MRNVLILPFLLGLSSPVQAEIDRNVIETCLPAVDFEGCVRVLTRTKAKTIYEINNKDILGIEKIPGWRIIENHLRNEVLYINEKGVKKVMVRGLFGRYITYDYVKRYYVEPIAATPGRYGDWIPGETVCKKDENEERCKTKPATRNWYPGRASVPGYVEQVSTYVVIDCLDRTGKWSTGNLRWRKIKGTQAENIANSYCSTIDILPESSISKYKKGSPTEDDFRAFNTLRINEQSLE